MLPSQNWYMQVSYCMAPMLPRQHFCVCYFLGISE